MRPAADLRIRHAAACEDPSQQLPIVIDRCREKYERPATAAFSMTATKPRGTGRTFYIWFTRKRAWALQITELNRSRTAKMCQLVDMGAAGARGVGHASAVHVDTPGNRIGGEGGYKTREKCVAVTRPQVDNYAPLLRTRPHRCALRRLRGRQAL